VPYAAAMLQQAESDFSWRGDYLDDNRGGR